MYESMVFYRSFYEAIRLLPEESRVKIYDAIFAYGLDGVEIELEGIEKAMFQLIKPQIDANNKRKENGKKGAEYGKLGGRPKKEPQENPNETPRKPQENPNETPNVNVNANVNVNVKEKESKKKSVRFSPPTVSDVKEYCLEKGLTIDAERFVNFYESKGWYVGKNKMKDWRSAVRGWASRERSERKPQTTKFSNFHERKYDDGTMLSLIEL